MKALPIGTQDFETLRRDDCLYVDKTADIHRLITEGRVYFLARPRRFGKSLLVSTLKAIFEGRRDLFQGLAIDALPYELKPHPVLHLDFEDYQGHTFCRSERIDSMGQSGEMTALPERRQRPYCDRPLIRKPLSFWHGLLCFQTLFPARSRTGRQR